jgi:hypothetical protein
MDLQIARARGSLAVPENTFTKSKQYWLLTVVMENPPDLADESFLYRNKRSIGCKPNLWLDLGAHLKLRPPSSHSVSGSAVSGLRPK